MRVACGECRRAKLDCELHDGNNVACSNCVERGYADVCVDEQACIKTIATPEPSTGDPSFSTLRNPDAPQISSFFYSFLIGFQKHLINQGYNLLYVLQCIYISILLCLPVYYASQASNVLTCVENSKHDYEQWTSTTMDTPVVQPVATNVENVDDIEMQTLAGSLAATQSNLNVDSSMVLTHAMPESVFQLQEAWTDYIDSRVTEWRILTTTSCVFVAASPTILQIPEASDDPVTRLIAFLALCRALSGIIYGPIFLIHFRQNRARTAHHAVAWSKGQKLSDIMRWNPWIMLSLPAVATCWAFIFFMFAIFSFIWRTGSVTDPSPTSPSYPEYSPMAIPLALAVRIIITAVTVVDLGCVVWIWKSLREYDADAGRSNKDAT